MKESHTGIGICRCYQCRMRKKNCSTSGRKSLKRAINKFRRKQLKLDKVTRHNSADIGPKTNTRFYPPHTAQEHIFFLFSSTSPRAWMNGRQEISDKNTARRRSAGYFYLK